MTTAENRQNFQYKSIIKALNANAGFHIDVAFCGNVILRNIHMKERSFWPSCFHSLVTHANRHENIRNQKKNTKKTKHNTEYDIVLSIVKVISFPFPAPSFCVFCVSLVVVALKIAEKTEFPNLAQNLNFYTIENWKHSN